MAAGLVKLFVSFILKFVREGLKIFKLLLVHSPAAAVNFLKCHQREQNIDKSCSHKEFVSFLQTQNFLGIPWLFRGAKLLELSVF